MTDYSFLACKKRDYIDGKTTLKQLECDATFAVLGEFGIDPHSLDEWPCDGSCGRRLYVVETSLLGEILVPAESVDEAVKRVEKNRGDARFAGRTLPFRSGWTFDDDC